jgi:transposase
VHLLYLYALGVPAYRIRFYLSISLSTIERTFRIFRQSIYNESLQKLKELKKLSGEIEMDEALFGGHRKGKRGWGAEGKSLVFGIYQRNGNVITFPVSDRKQDTLIPLIKLHTKKGSLYYTDDHTAYASLELIGKHQIIAHGMEEYVREDTSHINGIEGFWSYAKTWLYHYRGVPKQYGIEGRADRVVRNGIKDSLAASVAFRSIACPFLYTVKVTLSPADLC